MGQRVGTRQSQRPGGGTGAGLQPAQFHRARARQLPTAAHPACRTSFPGQRGQLHALYQGRVTILSFIYTHCDDVNGCPLASFVMGQIAKRLSADARIAPKLRLVSFSFDPKRDTPAELERYAKPFRPKGVDRDFVTSPSLADLKPTLTAYQQSVQQSEGHAFAHIRGCFSSTRTTPGVSACRHPGRRRRNPAARTGRHPTRWLDAERTDRCAIDADRARGTTRSAELARPQGYARPDRARRAPVL